MNNDTATVAAFDADTADTDALRDQVKAVTSQAARNERRIAELDSDLSVAVNLIRDLADGNEDDIREMCSNDERLALFVREHNIVDISRDYEVRITIPVTLTIIVSGDNEDDAMDGIGEHLSNEVSISLHGAEDYDYDSYDWSLEGISEA
jgi:hypothetical protein